MCMKIIARPRGDKMLFPNFVVIKHKKDYFGVYSTLDYKKEITMGTTMAKACKKAKLLQIGFNLYKEYNKSIEEDMMW